MSVLEVTLADQDDELRQSAHVLKQWFELCRDRVSSPATVLTLRAAGVALRANWTATFHDTGIKSLQKIPKLHRVDHVADSVALFGPYLHLSTESSEAAHKRLKHMYRTYVRARLHACMLMLCSVLFFRHGCAVLSDMPPPPPLAC